MSRGSLTPIVVGVKHTRSSNLVYCHICTYLFYTVHTHYTVLASTARNMSFMLDHNYVLTHHHTRESIGQYTQSMLECRYTMKSYEERKSFTFNLTMYTRPLFSTAPLSPNRGSTDTTTPHTKSNRYCHWNHNTWWYLSVYTHTSDTMCIESVSKKTNILFLVETTIECSAMCDAWLEPLLL